MSQVRSAHADARLALSPFCWVGVGGNYSPSIPNPTNWTESQSSFMPGPSSNIVEEIDIRFGSSQLHVLLVVEYA